MFAVFQMLAPVLLLIAVGGFLRRLSVLSAEGWAGVDRLLYFLLFPALVVEALSKLTSASSEAIRIALVLGGGQAVLVAILYLLRPVVIGPMGRSRPAFSSFVQAGVRWNTMLAVALSASLFGEKGVLLIACGISVMVPFANFISVSALTLDGDNDRELSVAGIAGQLVRNPFLIAVAIGMTLAISPLKLPTILEATLHHLALAAPSLGLMSVGAALNVGGLGRFDGLAYLSAGLKLLTMPAVVFGLATVAGLEGMAFSIAMLAASVPTASASYVLARQMGGDADLMARIITIHTTLALFTVPAILALVV